MRPTAIPRVTTIRASQKSEAIHSVYEPALCIIAQGAKQVLVGDQVHHYDPTRFLAVSVDIPHVGHVTEASPEKPYLCVKLDIDRATIASLALDLGEAPKDELGPGLAISPVTPELLDATVRLLRLLDSPRDIPVLAPMAERELLYRLLVGGAGARLRQMAHADGRFGQINRAIAWIKDNFREGFSIETLAEEARMSASALHLHFKQVTAMTPLQFQKQLRLQEARRLILADAMDAASAGHEVGYESPSQFCREYRRLFGAPPMADVTRLRAQAVPAAF